MFRLHALPTLNIHGNFLHDRQCADLPPECMLCWPTNPFFGHERTRHSRCFFFETSNSMSFLSCLIFHFWKVFCHCNKRWVLLLHTRVLQVFIFYCYPLLLPGRCVSSLFKGNMGWVERGSAEKGLFLIVLQCIAVDVLFLSILYLLATWHFRSIYLHYFSLSHVGEFFFACRPLCFLSFCLKNKASFVWWHLILCPRF